jgi:hypothetical protein
MHRMAFGAWDTTERSVYHRLWGSASRTCTSVASDTLYSCATAHVQYTTHWPFEKYHGGITLTFTAWVCTTFLYSTLRIHSRRRDLRKFIGLLHWNFVVLKLLHKLLVLLLGLGLVLCDQRAQVSSTLSSWDVVRRACVQDPGLFVSKCIPPIPPAAPIAASSSP